MGKEEVEKAGVVKPIGSSTSSPEPLAINKLTWSRRGSRKPVMSQHNTSLPLSVVSSTALHVSHKKMRELISKNISPGAVDAAKSRGTVITEGRQLARWRDKRRHEDMQTAASGCFLSTAGTGHSLSSSPNSLSTAVAAAGSSLPLRAAHFRKW